MRAGARRPVVLAIGGSDSSGGAGIAADLAAARDLGADLRLAVTAVTAQSDTAAGRIVLMEPALVREQIAMALADGRVGAVKVGMLGSAAIVDAVVDALASLSQLSVVLDPVLATSSGTALLDEDGTAVMIARLLPLTALVTPNVPELARLGRHLCLEGDAGIPRAAAALLENGAGAVLAKGGHAESTFAEDLLFTGNRDSPVRLRARRLDVAMRGTGCRLATAIAVRLAVGDDLAPACRTAKRYLTQCLRQAETRADGRG